MENEREPQQQQPYPQQPYQQQPYPGYSYPYPPPPKKDDKTVLIVIVVVVIVAVVVMSIFSVLYWAVIGLAPSGHTVPTGVWGTKTIVSATEVHVEFGRVNPEPRPVDLEIILVRNQSVEGKYVFAHNLDGDLVFASGTDVGDLTYHDLADNRLVNTGDHLEFTHLSPSSDYTLRMIWGPTGDMITMTTFPTP